MHTPPAAPFVRPALLPPIGLIAIGALATVGCTAGASITRAGDTDGSAQAHAITLSIDAVEEGSGSLRVALYDGAEGFAAEEPIATFAAAATESAITLPLGEFPDGDYAVMLYQDLNRNETLDRNLLGIPREPWAGSLGRAIAGPPGWDDVRFELDGADVALSLSL